MPDYSDIKTEAENKIVTQVTRKPWTVSILVAVGFILGVVVGYAIA